MATGMGEVDLNKERLELALEAAGLDLWENDLITGNVTRKATKTFEELGFTEEEIVSGVQDIYGLFHPDDIDTYVEDPQGNIVWYHVMEAGLMNLERDDRGDYKNMIVSCGRTRQS